jgi:hypothetical protein
MTVPLDEQTAREWLAAAVEEARTGRAEGGIPIGAARASTATPAFIRRRHATAPRSLTYAEGERPAPPSQEEMPRRSRVGSPVRPATTRP